MIHMNRCGWEGACCEISCSNWARNGGPADARFDNRFFWLAKSRVVFLFPIRSRDNYGSSSLWDIAQRWQSWRYHSLGCRTTFEGICVFFTWQVYNNSFGWLQYWHYCIIEFPVSLARLTVSQDISIPQRQISFFYLPFSWIVLLLSFISTLTQ